MDWVDRIGRRVKLRDLHILLAVAELGSMSKAAERLAISHPVISKTIADLEHALGVRLFDRGVHGVDVTEYGRTILNTGIVVFDELRRGVKQLDYLKDPTVGDLSIGATEPVMCGLILAVMQRMIATCPRIKYHNLTGDTPSLHRALYERRVDLVVARRWRSGGEDDLTAEVLFNEELVVVARRQHPLCRARKLKLSDVLPGPWVLPERDNAAGLLIAEGFRSIGQGTLTPHAIQTPLQYALGSLKGWDFSPFFQLRHCAFTRIEPLSECCQSLSL